MFIPQFKGFSNKQQRDFNAYKNIASVIIAYQLIDLNAPEHTASSLEEWYFLWDTHGIKSNYSDLQTCFKIVQAKATLNLTIQLWIEDIIEGGWSCNPILTAAEVQTYCETLPRWVYKSFCNKLNTHTLYFTWQKPKV